MYVMEQSYVSFTGVLVLLISAIIFVPSKLSRKRRVMIGVLHVAAHLMAALILMLMLELGIEICVQHNLLANSGQFPYNYNVKRGQWIISDSVNLSVIQPLIYFLTLLFPQGIIHCISGTNQ